MNRLWLCSRCFCFDLQLLDRDGGHQDDSESPHARSPLHLAVSIKRIKGFVVGYPIFFFLFTFLNSNFSLQAYHGHAQALEVLLQGEREVDQGDEMGRTALALAALRGHSDCVHTLLSQGASPRTTDKQYGRTPVHLAGELRNMEACNLAICRKTGIEIR